MLTRLILPLSCIPVFLTAVYALVVYRKLKREYQVFSWFLVFSGIIQLITLTLWWLRKPNLVYLHIYVIGGFFCLAWFYRVVLKDFIHPRIVDTVIVLFTIFAVLNSIFGKSITAFDSTGSTVEAALIIIFALSTFLLTQNEIVRNGNLVELRGLNWINSGLLIFFASTILLYYFGDTIMRSFPPELSRYSWTLHAFFSVILYTCSFTGLWKSTKI
jgi:hypothetical protein